MAVAPAHAPTVSRVLNAARHRRSVSSATRVRGYHRRTEGFRVQSYPEAVTVTHEMPSGAYRGDESAKVEAAVARYHATLTAAGYVGKVEGTGYDTRVVVTGKAAS